MKWQDAPDIQVKILELIDTLSLTHLKDGKIVCYRSFGSTSRALARIWGLPRVWQQALNVHPHYVVEILSEKFDKLSLDEKKKVLIHELLHIPKNFSGALLPHRQGKKRINRMVEELFKQYKNLKQ